MAVTQYIGARYVPKFYENSDGTEEWRAGVEYEPLTIVTYNGNSYTSKKPVPSNIGNPSDNPTYWVSTGNYNEQVEAYRQEVLGYKADAEKMFDELDQRIDNIGGRKVIFISDSYADNNRGGYAKGIYTTFCQQAALTDQTNAWCYARGGAGMAAASQGSSFLDLANSAISAHTSDASEITDVFIAGGANDVGQTQGDINTAKDNVFNALAIAFPKARIYVAVVSGFIDAASRKNLMNKVRYTYYFNLPNSRITPVENAHLPMMFYNCYVDNVHPNSNGCMRIGKLLADVFRTGNSYGAYFTRYQAVANCTAPDTGASGILRARINVEKTGYEFMIAGGSNGEQLPLRSSINITFNNGVTFAVAKVTSLQNIEMLVPNAASVDEADPVFRIPAKCMAFFDGTLPDEKFMPLDGELIGVNDGSDLNVVWYFRALTAPKTVTATSCRWVPFKVHIF